VCKGSFLCVGFWGVAVGVTQPTNAVEGFGFSSVDHREEEARRGLKDGPLLECIRDSVCGIKCVERPSHLLSHRLV
jgi:hypothetical protein